MSSAEEGRDQEIRSALERLPLAVIVIEDGATLRAYNRRATALFERESIADDLLKSRPSHPLARFIASALDDDEEADPVALLEFPSGVRYHVELSQRSPKGRGRMLMLLLQPHNATISFEAMFDKWQLTAREREVVTGLIDRRDSDSLCEAMHISPETLKTHIRNILGKAEVRSRTELIATLLSPNG
jgi:DNA-binding CsgD family transcriptional regulator